VAAWVAATERAWDGWHAWTHRTHDALFDSTFDAGEATELLLDVNRLWQWLWWRRCYGRPLRHQSADSLLAWVRLARRLLTAVETELVLRPLDWRECRGAIITVVTHLETVLQENRWIPLTAPTIREAGTPLEPFAVGASIVRTAWEGLRTVARSTQRTFPPEPTHVRNPAEARSGLDTIENWCRGPTPDAQPAAPTGPRITYDRDTTTVCLDGHHLRVKNRLTFRVFSALVEAHNTGRTPINRFDLFVAAKLENKDPRPERLWQNLPAQLRTLIQSDATPNGGSSLCLPPLPR
jgi:hypothetical protein